MRRWQAVVSLVQPETGRVAIIGSDGHPVLQALIRHDPTGFAHRELESRKSASMLPAFSVAEVVCARGAWLKASAQVTFDEAVRILGPVPVGMNAENEPIERVLVCSPRSKAAHTATELRAILSLRSSQKIKGQFSVRIDPVHVS